MRKNACGSLSLIVLGAVMVAACDTPLVAPIASTISVAAQTTVLQPGGTTQVTAVVVEEAGTLVHDGTVVRFSATLGLVQPEEVETTDGVARATFTAGSTAGTARVVATSGGAVSNPEQPNVVEIVIGAAN